MNKKAAAMLLALCCTASCMPSISVSADSQYEFESGTIYDIGDNMTEVQSRTGASGGKVVALMDSGDSVTLNIQADQAGAYTLGIRYCQPFDEGGKTQNVLVNGIQIGTINCALTGENQYKTANVTASLKAGANTVTVEASWGWTYLDSLTVTEKGSGSSAVSAKLSNPNATAETQSLYAYLCDTYGNYVLAG